MNLVINLLLLLIKCYMGLTASAGLTLTDRINEGRIIGGHESKPHNHPYLVSLQSRFLWLRMHICGGSLLNERWVLTAAHCTKESWLIRWLPLDAIAGAHNIYNFEPKVQIRTIDQRIEHPLYEGGIGPHDIAVLRMETPLTLTDEIRPIKLPYSKKINKDNLLLAGWGALKTTIFIPDLPRTLQEVNVTYIPYDDCHKSIDQIKDCDEPNPLDKEAHICTGPLSGGVAACSGDSGGPLIQLIPKSKYDHRHEKSEEIYDDNYNEVNDNNIGEDATEIGDTEKIPTVLGVVSWGMSPCGDKGAPTVYTRVSQYTDFIEAHLKE